MQTLFGTNETDIAPELAGVVITMLTCLILVDRKAQYGMSEEQAETLIEHYYNLRDEGYDMAEAFGQTAEFHRLID